MTGTALTEAEEFSEIYKLDLVEIPTNKPLIRKDYPDAVYKTEAGKLRAIIRQIEECHGRGQPVLVGTISIEKSEAISKLLTKAGIKHNVLNAKHHEKEAEIVAQAGKFGAVTIATNMAGRGTDIMLGGNPEYMAKSDMRKQGFSDELLAEATGFAETDDEEILNARRVFTELYEKYKQEIKSEAEEVKKAGGLFIVGTERHDSRRIDNQLRGRSGRQGDPGESRFYLAMTDDIMRLFGSERILGMMDSLGIDEDTPIDQKVLSNAIESAQGRVESRNFQTRKTVLEYDDVMNKQREIIYGQRKKVLDGEDLQNYIHGMTEEVIERGVKSVLGEGGHIQSREQLADVLRPFEQIFLPPGSLSYTDGELESLTAEELAETLKEKAFAFYAAKEKALGSPLMRELERVIMLRVVDEYWMEHIDMMQELRRGIGLRAYANTDPVNEYKREGFAMFDEMIAAIREETVRRVFVARVRSEEQVKRQKVAKNITEGGGDGTVKRQPIKKAQKIGRNDPCPCGKMKEDGSRRLKYKECCGRDL
jgi:preprotein translocase subunit SecA